jgi:cell division protein FtsQ
MIAASRRRGLPRPRVRLPHLGRTALIALAVVIVLLVGFFFWVRQSSLVAVRKVTVTGVTGPDAAQIRQALRSAGLGLSTLHLDRARLQDAVSPYPMVDGLSVHTHFPHGLRIEVAEQIPVAQVVGADRTVTVSADGVVLAHPHPSEPLPTITLTTPAPTGRLTGPGEAQVRLLAAAPYALLGKVATAGRSAAHGLTASLRDGPAIYFGEARDLAEKWRAAAAVLADPSSTGAVYIDVTDPARPAAGSGADSAR